MVIFLILLTPFIPREPREGKRIQQDRPEQRDQLEQRHKQFVEKSSRPLLLREALIFTMDDDSSLRNIIDERNEWIRDEYEIILQKGKKSAGIQFKNGVLSCNIAARPDLFSIEEVLFNFSISYDTDVLYHVQELENNLLARGFSPDDLKHLRFWRTPGNSPLEVINRTAENITWMYPEKSVYASIAKGKHVTDEEIEAQLAMEESSLIEAKTQWGVDFLAKLSKNSRRVILSYTFTEFTPSLTENRYIDPSSHIRDQVLLMRSIEDNPGLLKQLQDTIKEKINGK